MVEQLKEILSKGIERALTEQVESTNKSFVMQGKGDAFKEVLQVIEALEQQEKESGSKDSTPAKKEEAEK